MDIIISKIIEVEQRAQQIVEEANYEKEKNMVALQDELNHLQQEIQQRVENKIKQIKEKEMSETQKKLEELNRKFEEQERSLIQYADQHRNEWIDALLNQIIGR